MKCEAIFQELVSVWEGDAHIVEVYEVIFRVPKPKLQELIENSKEYFDFLIKTYGKEGKAIVNKTIEGWKAWLDSIKDETYEEKTRVARVKPKNNGSINFGVHLYKFDIFWLRWDISDPVNLVFYGPAGSAWDVQFDMKYWLTNKWSDTWGWNLYTWIDRDHADGADWIWKKQDYQLRHGDYYGISYHIRIYDGGYDWDKFKEWSIAGVHKEHWEWILLRHVVDDWEGAERFVREDFSGEWFVGRVWY